MNTFIEMKFSGCAEAFVLLKKVGFGNSIYRVFPKYTGRQKRGVFCRPFSLFLCFCKNVSCAI